MFVVHMESGNLFVTGFDLTQISIVRWAIFQLKIFVNFKNIFNLFVC